MKTRGYYNSVDNFILAQYSKMKLTNMIENQKFEYDYILFMRPDCKYIDKISLDFFNLINNNTILIPNFHLYGPYNFNDRFCIANMNTYKIYGNIFTNLLELSKSEPLHSETIIGKVIDYHNLHVIRIPFNFSRVWFNGYEVDKYLI